MFLKYLFIWLHQILVRHAGFRGIMWDLFILAHGLSNRGTWAQRRGAQA